MAVQSTPPYAVLRGQIETIERALHRMLDIALAEGRLVPRGYACLQTDARTLRAQLAHTPEQIGLQAVWVELLRGRRVKRAMRPGMRAARSHGPRVG